MKPLILALASLSLVFALTSNAADKKEADSKAAAKPAAPAYI